MVRYMEYAARLAIIASFVFGCTSAEMEATSPNSVSDVTEGVETRTIDVTPVAVCGDGSCDPGEQCDADCVTDCWTTQCGLQQAACLANTLCSELKACVWSCPTEVCANRCRSKFPANAYSTFSAYLSCGISAGCYEAVCGDGRCQPDEDCNADCAAPDSCYGRCNFTFDNGKPCQCDTKCSDNNDCCDDYIELCVAGAAICGDGECESPDESLLTCPLDCGTPVDQCLAGPCNNALIACYNTSGCSLLRGCLETCTDDNACTLSCLDAASQAASDALQVLLSCGEQAGCFDN